MVYAIFIYTDITNILEVREAVQLNGRLATANDHQQCVIDSYKKELDTYQKDCIKLKVGVMSCINLIYFLG